MKTFCGIFSRSEDQNSENICSVSNSCRRAELQTPHPVRSRRLYPPSIAAIKLNGHTNHIVNVVMEPEPRRRVQIDESISEIAH